MRNVIFFLMTTTLLAQSPVPPLETLSRILPPQTCFLVSAVQPLKLERQFLQTDLGRCLHDQDFKLLLHSWFSRFSTTPSASAVPFLEQFLAFRNFFDQELSLAGILLSEQTPTLASVLIGKTSRMKDLQYFMKNPRPGWEEEITSSLRYHPEAPLPFYEIPLQNGTFFFIFLDSYFLGSFSLEVLQTLTKNIQSPPETSLFQEDSFQKLFQELSQPPDLFGYVSFDRLWHYFFPTPSVKTQELLRFFGAYSIQNLSISLFWKQNQWQDQWKLQLKDRVWGVPSMLRDGANSFSSSALCPPNTLFFLSLKCSPARMVRLILEGLDRIHRQDGLSSWDQVQKALIFSTLEQSLGGLENELSAFLAVPKHGFLPDIALMAPLKDAAPFFKQLTQLLQKQETFALFQETYLDAPIYILSPKNTSGWIWAWSWTQQHLVFSYSLSTLKKILKSSRTMQPSLASSPLWKRGLEKTLSTEPHQGLFWIHSQQLFRQGYETLEQFLSVFPTPVPFNSHLLPDTDKLATYLDFSALLFDTQGIQLSASSCGDIHSSQGWYFAVWEIGSWIWASYFCKNLPTPETNEKAIVALLQNLAESQKQFQFANELDRDQDGVGEYGWIQELAGGFPLWRGQGEVRSFLPAWIGIQAREQQGIVLSSGYCFKLYLPSETGPALHEPEFFDWKSTKSPSIQDADAQELRWIAYAWPLVRNKTGRRCFAIHSTGTLFVSEDAPYQGWHFIPAPEACFALGATSKEEEQARNLEGRFPINATPVLTYDGFYWSLLDSEK